MRGGGGHCLVSLCGHRPVLLHRKRPRPPCAQGHVAMATVRSDVERCVHTRWKTVLPFGGAAAAAAVAPDCALCALSLLWFFFPPPSSGRGYIFVVEFVGYRRWGNLWGRVYSQSTAGYGRFLKCIYAASWREREWRWGSVEGQCAFQRFSAACATCV